MAMEESLYYSQNKLSTARSVWDFGLPSKLFAGMKHADQNEITPTKPL